MRLIAGTWVVRGGEILVLQRRSGTSRGLWMPPGGLVDLGETPRVAAVRETLEETGLVLTEPEFLSDWVWQTEREPWHVHHFIEEVPVGEVVISREHVDFRWMDPRAYRADHIGLGAAVPAPRFVIWLEEMRQSLDLVCDWISAREQDGTRP